MKVKCLFAVCAAFAALSAAGCRQGTGILDFHPKSEVVPMLSALREAAPGDPACLTLLHFSDLHGDGENLARIAEFKDAYQSLIDDAIHAGDAVICYWDNPNEWDNVPGARTIMNVVGNHDCWKGHKVWSETPVPYDASAEDAYQLIMVGGDKEHPFIGSWNVVQPSGVDDPASPHWCACYYYKDYPASAIRLVALDAMHYTAEQDAWFASVLEDARASALAVVAVEHYPSQTGLEPLPTAFSEAGESIPAQWDPTLPQMECMSEAAFAAVDNFIDAGGTFICWLGGHTHFDYIGLVPGHDRQMQIIADKAGEGDQYMKEDRTRGTRNQDSFNLITFNPGKGILTVNRIGCDADAAGRSKKQFVYDYIGGRMVEELCR